MSWSIACAALATASASAEDPSRWAEPAADLAGAIGGTPLHAAFALDDDASDEAATAVESTREFGTADSLRLNLLGGVVSNLSTTTGPSARLEFEYFMADRFSIVPLAELGWLAQDDAEDAFLSGGAVLLRWHLLHEHRPQGRSWTIYADAGVGLAYLDEEVPAGTNRLKFSPQVGIGFTWALEDDPTASRLMGGVRWYHLSNARTASSNDGFDGVMAYLGLSIPF